MARSPDPGRPSALGRRDPEPGSATSAPARPRRERQAAFRLGLSAESRAAALLIAKGFRIAARRWRTPLGEVDIVARRGDLLAFVEVKARDTVEAAAWSLTPRQRRRIIGGAEAWLAAHPADAQRHIRFDVVLVAPWRLPAHIVNAFDASPCRSPGL